MLFSFPTLGRDYGREVRKGVQRTLEPLPHRSDAACSAVLVDGTATETDNHSPAGGEEQWESRAVRLPPASLPSPQSPATTDPSASLLFCLFQNII